MTQDSAAAEAEEEELLTMNSSPWIQCNVGGNYNIHTSSVWDGQCSTYARNSTYPSGNTVMHESRGEDAEEGCRTGSRIVGWVDIGILIECNYIDDSLAFTPPTNFFGNCPVSGYYAAISPQQANRQTGWCKTRK